MQCFLSFVTTKIMPFSENYLQSAKTLDHGGFSSVLIATRLAISKWSTFFLHCEHITTARLEITIRLRKSIPNQHILLHYSIIDSAQGKPANPFSKHKGILKSEMIFQPLKSHATLAVVKYKINSLFRLSPFFFNAMST